MASAGKSESELASLVMQIVKKTKKVLLIEPAFPGEPIRPSIQENDIVTWFFEKPKVQKKDGKSVLQYRKKTHLETSYKKLTTAVECVYCGIYTNMKNITRDHVRPRARGFALEPTNQILCCRSCNNRKDCRNLGEWIAYEFFNDHPFYLFIRPRIQKHLDENPMIDPTDWNQAIEMLDKI